VVPADEIDAASDPLIGRIIDDRFEIVGLIGTGGMGAVYRAHQAALRRDVAIKVLHPGRRHSPDAVSGFLREAQLASQLAHPNSVSVYDFGQTDDGLLYLVMELVEGNTLTHLVGDGRLSIGRVLRIAAQLCHALEAAHRVGIVHCDLKPANIVILHEPADRDHVVVLDFGLARALAADDVTASDDGTMAGTPAYMSPEAISGDQIDERSDLYSLGIVLYELLAGRRPFLATSVAAMCLAQLEQTPPTLPASVPRALSSVVMQLLRKNEHDRPASAELVRISLSRITAPVSGEAISSATIDDDAALMDTRTVRSVGRPVPRVELPTQPGDLIARPEQRARGVELLSQPEVRLVSLTGPGGTGKTRLAIEIARAVEADFDRIRFVPLAPLSDSTHVPRAIATALCVPDDHHTDLVAAAAKAVGRLRVLLIVDNAEHVVEGARCVADLVAAVAGLTIIVTTREVLRVRAETELSIPPFGEGEARQLFVARATAASPAFAPSQADDELVDRICAAVDRLPLGIELAAARVKVLSLPQLLERLQRSLDVLSRGPADAPERHRSLRAAMQSSYELLTDEESAVFRRLSVFQGGADLTAIEYVVDGDSLDSVAALVDKSLVRRSGDDEPRFWMLATLREYAAERLAEAGEDADARRRHAEHYVSMCETCAPQLYHSMGSNEVAMLERDRDNVRAALDTAIGDRDDTLLQRGARALIRFWEGKCRFDEGTRYLRAALATDGPPAWRADLLTGLGTLGWRTGSFDDAFAQHCEAIALYADAGNTIGQAFAEHNAGIQLVCLERIDESQPYMDRTVELAERAGDRILAGVAASTLAVTSIRQGKPQAAIDRLEPLLASAHYEPGGVVHGLAAYNVALAWWHLGRYDEAADKWIELVSAYDFGAGEIGILDTLSPIPLVMIRRGATREAARVYGSLRRTLRDSEYVHDVEELDLLREAEATLGQKLGAEAEELIAEGERLPLEDAVALALRALTGV
jgi:non-specific serine/threonine protein kinase